MLAAAGFEFVIDAPEIDESPRSGETPRDHVVRLATEKALATAAAHPTDLVLGADTTIDLDGTIIGKPADRDDAAGILATLSGRDHRVHTATAVVLGDDSRSGVATATVRFRSIGPDEISDYLAEGESLDKAGAYAIQGAGFRLATVVDGETDTVVGLNLRLVRALLGGFTGAGPPTD